MAIRTVITRGYGNGTFNGTIPLVVTRGYTPAATVADAELGWHDLASHSWTHGDSNAFPQVQIRRNVERKQTIQANVDQSE